MQLETPLAPILQKTSTIMLYINMPFVIYGATGAVMCHVSAHKSNMAFISLVAHPTYQCICPCFISTQDGTTPLLMAASKGHLDIADILIAAGAKVDLAKDVSFKVLYM